MITAGVDIYYEGLGQYLKRAWCLDMYHAECMPYEHKMAYLYFVKVRRSGTIHNGPVWFKKVIDQFEMCNRQIPFAEEVLKSIKATYLTHQVCAMWGYHVNAEGLYNNRTG
jgi:hypothetical protein